MLKCLYTNVLVEEAIETAIKELYSIDEIPTILRSAMKSLLRLAVTNVHFKCKKSVAHSIGHFSNGCFASCNFGKFVDEIF